MLLHHLRDKFFDFRLELDLSGRLGQRGKSASHEQHPGKQKVARHDPATGWSMSTRIPPLPDLTLPLVPSRSPAAGVALPVFDTRAPITISLKRDNFISGVIADESSKENL